MITACINVFNDADVLPAALESVAKWVDRIIVVDGAYEGFPYHGNNGASDDGTLEVVKRCQALNAPGVSSCKIDLIEAPGHPWRDEMEKRTFYCTQVENGDWLFVLDADERLVFGGEWLKLAEAIREDRNFDLGVCLLRFKGEEHYGTMGRLYKKKAGMKYGNSHAYVVYSGGYKWRELFVPLVIEEDHSARKPERNAQRLEYYKSGRMQ